MPLEKKNISVDRKIIEKITSGKPDYSVHSTDYTARVATRMEKGEMGDWSVDHSDEDTCFNVNKLLFIRDCHHKDGEKYWYYNKADKKECENIMGSLTNDFSNDRRFLGIIVFKGDPYFYPKDLDYCQIFDLTGIEYVVKKDGTVIKIYDYDTESG